MINLPTHTFPTDDGGVDMKCPTEIAITDRREAELSKAGIISIIHRKNTDKAAFIGAQSVYKPKLIDKPEATAADNLSARIPYMFAVSRFAHYLKCMVRDKIGSTKEKDQLESWLNDWIIALRRRRSQELERRGQGAQAARGAKVTVIANEENPGYYSANFYLRPHFQLEGMDIGMSLVARRPNAKLTLRGESAAGRAAQEEARLSLGVVGDCHLIGNNKERLDMAGDMFLELDGIVGESKDENYKDQDRNLFVLLGRLE